MAYRNELEAAQARAGALERELANAKSKIAKLEGSREESTAIELRAGTALARNQVEAGAAQRWLGGPLRLVFERSIEGEIPDSAHTELVELMRRRLSNVGTTSVLPGSLAWSCTVSPNSIGPFVHIYIAYRDGRTQIRAEQKLGNLAGGIFGGFGGGVGAGGIVLPILVATAASPLLIPVAVVGWMGAVYGLCRRSYRARSDRHAKKLEILVDDLCDVAEKHIRRKLADESAQENAGAGSE